MPRRAVPSSRLHAPCPRRFLGVATFATALFLALALAGCQLAPVPPPDMSRITIDATINQQPVHFAFDSGSEATILFRPTAQRLKLDVTEPSAGAQAGPGKVLVGITEPCAINLFGTQLTGQFGVLDIPPGIHPETDGVLAWDSLRNNVIVFDPQTLRTYIDPPWPQGMGSWQAWPIARDSRTLNFLVSAPGEKSVTIAVDTGDYHGVALAPDLWQAWRAAHPRAPHTLDAYYMPGAGLVTREECWAADLTLGPLHLTNVPVEEANVAEIALGGKNFAAKLGLYALTRLALVVDGPNNLAYTKTQTTPSLPYEHNRLGAVFVPSDAGGDTLFARVVPGSPAALAGIHDGDSLLSIDGRDVTDWRTNPDLHFSHYWEKPAGTHLVLLLQRDGKAFRANPILRDLLGPGLAEAE